VVFDWYGEKRKQQDAEVSNHLLFVLNKIAQMIIYTGAFVVILFAFQIDLSGVVVGLGVGGIAIALAVQSTLGDIFSAFSIYFDRPFEIGDFVVIGDYAGTVKSTRLQLLQGEELVISNKELTGTSLRNFKKLQKRRVVFTLGVTYDTPLEKLKKIPGIIEEVIKDTPHVQFDRAHFSQFADFSLKFEVVYYVSTGDYVK
jgi:small-conductance mechanosensitive channel